MDIFHLPGRICSTEDIRRIAEHSATEFTFIYLRDSIRWVNYAEERMLQVMRDTGAVLGYSDHFDPRPAPVIDYQAGALRDDFDFGSVLCIRTSALRAAVSRMDVNYSFAGLYDLRLKLYGKGGDERFVHINEYLYYDEETDLRKSGEKLFDYVDPRNRQVQVEMEQCVTRYLQDLGALIHPDNYLPLPQAESTAVTASVVIPCKNRARTIRDAIRSAVSQQVHAPYTMNVFVVDDNSTDGTVDIIREEVERASAGPVELIYIAQDTSWHAIGGNWNAALHHPKCGKYAIQLDSDDTYSCSTAVQQFIDTFESADGSVRYAMVIGSYQMTDIEGNPLPPGKIDHAEWTDLNGMNNALRINGLGAPRGFYVPLVKTMNFPTTKYGEDYAVGLRICRQYPIGRIWDVVYNCRRWDDNSDANCDVEAMNRNNLYKDRVRTWELSARMRLHN